MLKTHAYVNPEKVDVILTDLNSYHQNIQFAFKIEKKKKQITFLDVLVKRTAEDQSETCVYIKETSTDLYINRNAHALLEWKIGALRNLVKRTKTACSTKILLHQEIEHLKAVFTGINKYPIKIGNRTVNQELHQTHRLQNTIINIEGTQKVQIMLLYNRKQSNKLLSKMKKYLNKALPTEVKTTVTYQSKKLGPKLLLKGKANFHQQSNLIYYSKCMDETCNEDYVSKKDRRI